MSRLIDMILEIEDPTFTKTENEANPPPAPPFTIRSWTEIQNMALPPRDTFLDEVFALAQTQAMQGQCGVGKSRVATNLARNNVLQIPFGGLSTGTRPYRWLFIGNENGLHRLKRDITAMSIGLNADQVKLLGDHIFMQSLETLDDSFICLSDDKVKQKWASTVAAIKPDIVVTDPWGEIQHGDPNNDLDTRQSLRDMLLICRRVNPNVGMLVLHHARTGRANISQAAGWDKGNFGKGSKALYSGARAVINLAPADPEDHSRIVMVCAKANDSAPFETRGLVLNSETMTYDVDPSFDLDAWTADVEGKRRPGNAKLTIQDIIDACQTHIAKDVLVDRIMEEKEVSKALVYRWILKAKEAGAIREGKKGLISTGKFNVRISVESADE